MNEAYIMNFLEAVKSRRLYLDGGMGSLIQKKVKNPGPVPEELNITHPEIIAEIQKSYVEAGADILVSNTFGANGYKAAASKYSVSELVSAGVKIAKDQNPAFTALDIGPLGTLIGDLGSVSYSKAVDYFSEMVKAGVSAGADLIIIETMTDIYEARAAVIAAKENSDLPIIASMTYESNGRTLTGTDPETAAVILGALGVDVIAVNCSTGPEQMIPIVETLVKTSPVPVAVEPNAGLPKMVGGETVYDIDADAFAKYMTTIAEKGAAILGGCCGTTPEHIARTVEATKNIPLKIVKPGEQPTRVCSSTKTVTLGKDIVVIGEAINPTTNPELKEDLRRGKMNVVKKLALEQKRQGADILDVNVGLPELDEKETFARAVHEISQVVDLPLQFDTTKPEVIEAALREYNGVPIINSVNGKKDSMDAILPLAEKYGACVLGLTLDETGLPKTKEKRVEIAEKIITEAEKYGIASNRILIDCLTLTASAQQKAVGETLGAITEIKARYHVPTVLGVSNISFGLPNRRLINRTFLTLALNAGLDTPILKSGDREMMGTIDAFRALSGADEGCLNYTAVHQNDRTQIEEKPLEKEEKSQSDNKEKSGDLKQMVIDGLKEEIVPAVQEMLKVKGPLEIVNEYLIPGLDEVGKKFEKGIFFLPNLIFSAETVQNAFAEIKKTMKNEEQVEKEPVILATVKGDVHDIGKNILKVVMENYGYHIIDLGKDVDTEVIADAVRKNDVKLVGLSALMTTTVVNMEATVKALKSEFPDLKIMVGGAVLNETYAQKIGADFYGRDAKAGVEIAQKVFS